MDLPAEQPAEIETESDGETEKKERLYDETLQYISYMSSMTDILRVPQSKT